MQQKNTPAREKNSVQFVSLLGILARIGSGHPIKHVHIVAAFFRESDASFGVFPEIFEIVGKFSEIIACLFDFKQLKGSSQSSMS